MKKLHFITHDFKRFYGLYISILLSLFICPTCFGQVGINTTNPNATLDIKSSNQATHIKNE